MKTFAELEAQDLHWVRAKRAWWHLASYQLRNKDGEVYATIQREGWDMVTVDAPGNRWKIERQARFLKSRRIVVTSVGTGEPPAEFVQKGHHGILTYPDGRVFTWKALGLGMKTWVWMDAIDRPVLGFELKGFWQTRGEIHIHPESTADKAPPLLLFLGWYLILITKSDAAAAIAPIAAVFR